MDELAFICIHRWSRAGQTVTKGVLIKGGPMQHQTSGRGWGRMGQKALPGVGYLRAYTDSEPVCVTIKPLYS